MPKLRSGLLWVLAALLLATPSCSTLQRLTRPTAKITGVKFSEVSAQALTLLFDVNVQNPYPTQLPLLDLDYKLASGTNTFLTGAAPINGSVPANGAKTVQLPARVNFSDALNILTNLKPGDVVAYAAELGLSVNAPGVGALRLPLSKQGEFPIPTVPEISLDNIEWETLSLDHAGAKLHLRVKNTNRFPVDLTKLAYALNLGTTQVAQTAVEQSVDFGAGEENTIDIPMSISPRNLGLALFNVITGSGSGYGLKGTMDLDTPFGPIQMPYEKGGQTRFTK